MPIAPSSGTYPLLRRVREEMVAGLRAGSDMTADSLIARHPQLANESEAVELIFAEYTCRRDLGQPINPDLWLLLHRRWAGPLRRRMEEAGAIGQARDMPPLTATEATAVQPSEGPPADLLAPLPPLVRLERIGRGGMGTVHRAIEVALDREVALKTINGGATASRQDRLRFHREARAAGRLFHPNIVPVYAMGTFEGEDAFTMPYFPGGTLAQKLARGRIPAREAAAILALVARAVQFAHDNGIVHRDLKPSNILLDASGAPHVADFGLASLHGAGSLTRSDAAMGTSFYMAPEQARGKGVGPAADVWALGVILYEMLTGKRPFEGSFIEVCDKVRTADPIPPRQVALTAPPGLEAIALRCLVKHSGSRLGSAGELADVLERWLAGEDQPVPPPAPPPPRHAAAASLAVLVLPLLLGAMMLGPFAEAGGEEARIHDTIRQGKPATLVGAAGLPAHYRWKVEPERTPLKAAGAVPLTFRAWGPVQMELLPAVPARKYRLDAEVALPGGDPTAAAGIYVLGAERRLGPFVDHTFFGLCVAHGPEGAEVPQSGLWFYTSPGPGGAESELRRALAGPPRAAVLGAAVAGLAAAGPFAPAGAAVLLAPRPRAGWHKLSLAVSPGLVEATFDGIPAGRWAREGKEAIDVDKLWKGFHHPAPPDLRPAPAFPANGGVGLYARGCVVQIRNVVITPNP
jgi:serine/threonine-protein kinase